MDVLKHLQENSLFKRFMREYPNITTSNANFKKYLEIHNYLESLKKYSSQVDIRKENGHFANCPWSNPDCECGPDTCLCCLIDFSQLDIERGLKELYNEG